MEIQLWRERLLPYELAVHELVEKFNHLAREHRERNLYSPIEQVTGRVKSVTSILEKMQRKAETELQMLQKEPDSFSRQQYQARLESTREQCGQRLGEMKEELNLILGLKEQLEQELHLRAGEIEQ